MDTICEKQLCTGCSACMNICPKQAITMQPGDMGHIFPVIDPGKCVDCGLCQAVCPAGHKAVFRAPKTAYAAWAKDAGEHKSSTSGGAAAVFTNYVLQHGGVVYGCVFDGAVSHCRIDHLSDAKKLKGSKYVHSHINETYQSVKRDLLSGILTLFIGTPCQVAGLKAFLRGKEYENLICVDLVCHGVPPQKLFFDYLKEQGIDQKDVEYVSFRESKGFYLNVRLKNNKVYRKSSFDDLYYMGFYDNILFRESCYNCEYATDTRVGDLTIGDFWGLGREIPFDEKTTDGVSLILVCSEAGERFLQNVGSGLSLFERPVSEAIKGNANLNHPSGKGNHDRFAAAYGRMPLKKALKKNLRIRRFKNVLLKVYTSLRRT